MTDFTDEIIETATATDRFGATAFYRHPPDHCKHVELRSVHDTLTNREAVSDPTVSHDDLLRTQTPPRCCP